jgi:hypothetical protein
LSAPATATEAVGAPSTTRTATLPDVLLLPTATQVVAVGQATALRRLVAGTWTTEPGTPRVTGTTSPPVNPEPTARQVVVLEHATP